MKVYLLAFGGPSLSRGEMAQILDRCELVDNWRSDLPFSFYIRSACDAKRISDDLKFKMGSDTRLFLTEITDNSDGFITKESWYFLLGEAPKGTDPEKISGALC